jgi:HEXXH motif-containing protein
MNDRSVLFAGPACSDHRQRVLAMVASHSRRQIEAVCRHYVEQQAVLGIPLGEAETLLRFAFLLAPLEDSATLRAFLMHPTTQYWLSAMRRASGEADRKYRRPFARNAGNLGLQLALATGDESRWPVELDGEGGMRLPILGRHVEFGRERASARTEADIVAGGARFRFDDGMTVEIPLGDLVAETVAPEPSLERDGFCLTLYERLMEGAVQLQRRDEWAPPPLDRDQ